MLLKGGLLVSLFFALYWGYSLMGASYEEYTHRLVESWDMLDALGRFREEYFRPYHYRVLQGMVCVVVLLQGGMLLFFKSWGPELTIHLKQGIRQLNPLTQAACQSWADLSRVYKRTSILLIMALFMPRVWAVFSQGLLVDEIFTYFYLVKRGFGAALVYYPGPNNHVFFSLLSTLWVPLVDLLVQDPVRSMRLLSLGIHLLSCLILFFFFLPKLHIGWILLGLLAWESMPPLFLYSFLARGYSLQLFLLLIGGICLYKIICTPHKWGAWWAFSVSQSLGIFTIPTHVLPGASLGLCLLIALPRPYILRTMGFGGITIVLSVFFYGPILLVSGTKSLVANDWVKPLDFKQVWEGFPDYMVLVGDFYWDAWGFWAAGAYGIIVLGSWGLTFFYRNQVKTAIETKMYGAMSVVLTFPFILLFVLAYLPFPRIWLFESVVSVIAGMALVKKLAWRRDRGIVGARNGWRGAWRLPKARPETERGWAGAGGSVSGAPPFISKPSTWGLICFLGAFTVLYLNRAFWLSPPPAQYEVLAQEIWQEGFRKIYVTEDTYQLSIHYMYRDFPEKYFVDAGIFQVENNYDLIIWEQNKVRPPEGILSNYRIYYEDSSVIAWKRANFVPIIKNRP